MGTSSACPVQGNHVAARPFLKLLPSDTRARPAWGSGPSTPPPAWTRLLAPPLQGEPPAGGTRSPAEPGEGKSGLALWGPGWRWRLCVREPAFAAMTVVARGFWLLRGRLGRVSALTKRGVALRGARTGEQAFREKLGAAAWGTSAPGRSTSSGQALPGAKPLPVGGAAGRLQLARARPRACDPGLLGSRAAGRGAGLSSLERLAGQAGWYVRLNQAAWMFSVLTRSIFAAGAVEWLKKTFETQRKGALKTRVVCLFEAFVWFWLWLYFVNKGVGNGQMV